MRDVVYSYRGDGEWACFDNIAQTSEQVIRTDTLDDGPHGVLREERIVRDAAGAILSRDVAESRRFGCGQDATLRQTYHATLGLEPDGAPGLVEDHASYWTDDAHPRRNGRPRLVWGESRPWSYQAWDAEGREILRLDPLDGSAAPLDFVDQSDPTDLTDLSDFPTITAIATVSDYAPLAGDSNPPAALDSVRTESRHLVRDGAATCIGRTWHVHTVGTDTVGRAFATVKTIRACSPTAAFDDPGNAVSTATRFDADAPGIPLLLRGRPLESTDEDGVTTACDYALGDYDPATRTFAPGGSGTALRTIARRSYRSNPSDTSDLTIQDSAHGTTLYSATLLHATGETLDWQAHLYDDKNRLRSTLYSDGSTSTNAYSCCRLLFTIDRDGRKTERLAQTGTDHLRYAMLDVSFPELPQNEGGPSGYYFAVPGAYSYARTYDFRATEHSFDAMGRRIRTRELATNPDRSQDIATLRKTSYGWEASETTSYPHGISDFQVHTDARGLVTQTAFTQTPAETIRTTDTFDGTALLMRTTSRTVRGGGSTTRREWDGEWTEASSTTTFAPDGRRIEIATLATSDAPMVTNSVVEYDFLGRIAASETPLSRTEYAYHGSSRRVASETEVRSGSVATPLYDELGDAIGSVADGVASMSLTTYELRSNAWWRVATSFLTADGRTNGLSVSRTRLTGLSNALRSCVETEADGATTRVTTSFDPVAKVSTDTLERTGMATTTRKRMFGREIEATDADGVTRYNYFDPYGRVYLTREFTGERLHWRTLAMRDSVGDVYASARFIGGTPHWNNVARFNGFDSRGNLVASTNEMGYVTHSLFDSAGRLAARFGAAYPVAYGYDATGRLKSLFTTRSGATWDVTHWNYDPATGLVTNKVYADGSALAHGWTPDGLPERTTWARGAWRHVAYNDRRLPAAVSYSDPGTPGHELSYDAFGRLVAVADAAGRRHGYAYGASAASPTNETAAADSATNAIARILDANGRPVSTTLRVSGAPRGGTWHAYADSGRLAHVAATNAQGRGLVAAYTNFRRALVWPFGRTALRRGLHADARARRLPPEPRHLHCPCVRRRGGQPIRAHLRCARPPRRPQRRRLRLQRPLGSRVRHRRIQRIRLRLRPHREPHDFIC
ncbi:MAG: hypothetical protein ACOX5G_07810 [Kiritimatiellia bacterium]